jgi:hypothetical protein
MLEQYINKQVIGSINNTQTVNSRLFIIFRLFQELLPAMIIVLLIFVFTYKYKYTISNSKWVYIFFAFGLSGVIPIMISLKQSGFYILATYPFFSISLALIAVPGVSFLINKINIKGLGFKIFKILGLLLLVTGLTVAFLQINKIGRDNEKVSDIYKVINIISNDSLISIEPSLRSDWLLHGYFQRYAGISLDFTNLSNHQYLLMIKGDKGDYLSKYKKVPVNLNLYELYKKDKGMDNSSLK